MSVTFKAVVASWLACSLAAACSTEDHGDGEGYLGGEAGVVTCSVQFPDGACTGPTPSFATDVAPILDAHCTGCHNPDGEYPSIRFDTYAQSTNRMHISTALTLVGSCQMPPAPLPPVPNDEASILYCWVSSCLSGKCVK